MTDAFPSTSPDSENALEPLQDSIEDRSVIVDALEVEPVPATTSEERTWASLAHLSYFLNLVSGFFGILAALIIYLVYQNRSRYIAYHALQSTIFQLIFWAGAGLIASLVWIVTIPLMAILIGFCLLPIAILISLIPLAAMIYSVIGAVKTGQGEDFRYWGVGDWVRKTLTG
jgi:uncharacterized protein